MQTDDEGFLYPATNVTECIDCGLCDKVCPMQNHGQPSTPAAVLATINPDNDARRESSSVGIFTLLAEAVIKEGCVVFGAVFTDNWQVEITAETLEELAPMRGSKYGETGGQVPVSDKMEYVISS